MASASFPFGCSSSANVSGPSEALDLWTGTRETVSTLLEPDWEPMYLARHSSDTAEVLQPFVQQEVLAYVSGTSFPRLSPQCACKPHTKV